MVFELSLKLTQIADRKAGVLSGGEQQLEDALMRARKELGVAILIVEQNLDFARSFADRLFVMQHGRMVKEGRKGDTPASD